MSEVSEIPGDIDAIATDIVRNVYDQDKDPDFELYQAIARAIMDERSRCAKIAYDFPHYVRGGPNGLVEDEQGRLAPGSPYDRGAYDAANRILAIRSPK